MRGANENTLGNRVDGRDVEPGYRLHARIARMR